MYIICLLNIRNISVFIYVSIRYPIRIWYSLNIRSVSDIHWISDPYPIFIEYPIRIRYSLNIWSVSISKTICIRKILTDMNTVRALSVRIQSVCNPNQKPQNRERKINASICSICVMKVARCIIQTLRGIIKYITFN
jgi:hypothetical protein